MQDEELDEFPWSILFLVTAASSLLFNIALKMLDGNFSTLLFFVSGFTAFFGIVNWLGKMLAKQSGKKGKSGSLSS
ncbi:MAG: hypothetical protein SGI96_18515 [Bacteroidota bacterium]|nr:hypothetical protein [Bacteroidota bacterium]